MEIILRENKWAEEALKGNELGNSIHVTFKRIARYYLDQGLTKKEVRQKMDEFLLKCEEGASLVMWSDFLDKTLNKACKYKAVDIEHISIYKNELETIKGLDGIQIQRVAFTLLCLAKYWKEINPDYNYWVTNRASQVMTLANVVVSTNRHCNLYHDLKETGLISFSSGVDNMSVRVNFVDESGEPELLIDDFRNLGNQYMMYLGEPFFKCQRCGAVVKYNNPKDNRGQKYCKDCADQVRKEKKAEWARENRKRKAKL